MPAPAPAAAAAAAQPAAAAAAQPPKVRRLTKAAREAKIAACDDEIEDETSKMVKPPAMSMETWDEELEAVRVRLRVKHGIDAVAEAVAAEQPGIAAENAIWDVLELEIKAYEVLRASGHFASYGEPFGTKATAPTPQRYTFWPKKRLELPLMYATAKAILGARIVSTTNEELHCRWLHLLKLRASMSMSQRRPWSGTSSHANTLTRCP